MRRFAAVRGGSGAPKMLLVVVKVAVSERRSSSLRCAFGDGALDVGGLRATPRERPLRDECRGDSTVKSSARERSSFVAAALGATKGWNRTEGLEASIFALLSVEEAHPMSRAVQLL
jgi:hypothetical protein